MVKRMSRLRNVLNSGDSGREVWSNQIPSSQESSETEFVEEEKPWPPPYHQSRSKTLMRQVARRVARPQSHLFRKGSGEGRERRSRHSRRWENSAFLGSLHVVPEDECAATPLPEHKTPFTRLHSSEKHMQIWTSFSSRPEEEQQAILESVKSGGYEAVRSEGMRGGGSVAGKEETAQDRYRRIDRRIRSVLQHHRHLPLELVYRLEEELRFLFSVDHHAVLLSSHPHSFSRLLLHGLSQYLGLTSTTVQCDGVSVVMVVCTADTYRPPSCWLSSYLKRR